MILLSSSAAAIDASAGLAIQLARTCLNLLATITEPCATTMGRSFEIRHTPFKAKAIRHAKQSNTHAYLARSTAYHALLVYTLNLRCVDGSANFIRRLHVGGVDPKIHHRDRAAALGLHGG